MKYSPRFLVFALLAVLPLLGFVPEVDDPLKKPAVWDMLSTNPRDSSLWASYLGKPWILMNVNEKGQISTWMDELMQAAPVENTAKAAVVSADANDDEIWHYREIEEEIKRESEEKLHKSQIAYLKDLEGITLLEPAEIVELKSNIRENFVILEDLYQEQFEALGIDYKPYAALFPRGNYSRDTWIREKEEELRKIKTQKLTALRQKLATGR